jgi:hypothetical protein
MDWPLGTVTVTIGEATATVAHLTDDVQPVTTRGRYGGRDGQRREEE